MFYIFLSGTVMLDPFMCMFLERPGRCIEALRILPSDEGEGCQVFDWVLTTGKIFPAATWYLMISCRYSFPIRVDTHIYIASLRC